MNFLFTSISTGIYQFLAELSLIRIKRPIRGDRGFDLVISKCIFKIYSYLRTGKPPSNLYFSDSA